jgi:hypothetical protein
MIISAMSDATSKRRQEERKSGGHKEFGQLLEEAKQQQQESRGMEGKTVGYTRTGQICIGQIMQRTYN